jgi:Na+/H+-dicarboxylate symporter
MINLLPFVIIILIALFFHALVSLPTIWYLLWGFNPFAYLMKVKEAILVWFSTASSSATMWLSMSVAKNKAELNEEVVNFTFPIGTTVNMDWTALYQAWVAIFVAQVLWIDLSIIQQLTIVIIVILASIWAAWVPWAWILILTTVFVSVWLPVEAIWIILAVDRILDMFRTWVNVWWDLLTAKVVDTYYKKELKSLFKTSQL